MTGREKQRDEHSQREARKKDGHTRTTGDRGEVDKRKASDLLYGVIAFSFARINY